MAPKEIYTVNAKLWFYFLYFLFVSLFFPYKSSFKCQTVFQRYQEQISMSSFEWNAADTPHKYKTQNPECEYVCIKVFVYINILTTSNTPGVCCALIPPVFCSSLGCVTVLWLPPPCTVCVCADCVNVQRLRQRLSSSWRMSWERRSWSWLISD